MIILDHAGYLASTVLVHVLAAMTLFKHPKHLPGESNTVYIFMCHLLEVKVKI